MKPPDRPDPAARSGARGRHPIGFEDARQLRLEEMLLLRDSLPATLVSAALGGVVLLLATWQGMQPVTGLAWLAGHLLILGLRVGMLRHVRRRPLDVDSAAAMRRLLLLGILLTGLSWGTASLLLFPPADPLRQVLLFSLLVAIAAGGVALHAGLQAAAVLFLVPTLLPVSVNMLLAGHVGNEALGIAGLLLFGVLLVAARLLGRHLRENRLLRFQVERRSQELLASQRKLALHVEHTPLAVIEWDRDLAVTSWNPGAERLFGHAGAAALGRPLAALVAPADAREAAEGLWRRVLAREPVEPHTLLNRTSDGRQIHCTWFDTPLVTDDDQVIGGASLVQDVTESIRAQAELRASEEKFRNLVERSLAGVYMIRNGMFSYVNPRLAAIFGYRAEEIVDRKRVQDLVAPQDQEQVMRNIQRRLDAEEDSIHYGFRGRRKDGSLIHVEVLGSRGNLGGEPVILGTLLDVTEAKQARAEIERLANFDPLTDLPNRRSIAEQADRLIDRARESRQPLTCLYIDLDRFKNVNDTLGHDVGDRLLREAAQRMANCLRDGDSLARMGGDEFTVLLPDADRHTTAQVAERLIRALSAPFAINGRLIRVGGSIGAAELDPDTQDFTTLWKRADIAMYRAKLNRGSFAFFHSRQEVELNLRVRIESDLAAAIANDELTVHYQPRVDLRDGSCASVEALVRWRHPELGLIAPGVFVPVAEESGVIHQLGEWVLARVCRQLRTWHGAGLELRAAVNLSAIELRRREIVASIAARLAAEGVQPQWLELEITESAAMQDPEHSVTVVGQLRDLGIAISIDDFGTGYSSLSYLKRIPASYLKIDRSFLRNVDGPAPAALADVDIVRVVIALARSLGLETVAEGVERADQAQFLLANGCHLAQGFHYCKPLPVAELEGWLRGRPVPRLPAAGRDRHVAE